MSFTTTTSCGQISGCLPHPILSSSCYSPSETVESSTMPLTPWSSTAVPESGGLECFVSSTPASRWWLSLSSTFLSPYWLHRLVARLQAEDKGSGETVNLRATLIEMRRFRMGLIQTPEQLRFAYVALVEALKRMNLAKAGSVSSLDIHCWRCCRNEALLQCNEAECCFRSQAWLVLFYKFWIYRALHKSPSLKLK